MPDISLPESLFLQPDLYFVEYRNSQALFAHMTRDTYFNSLFTDHNRIQAKNSNPVILDMDALCNALDGLSIAARPIGCIFHTANCGSTLLSRALDLPGRTIGYREPYPLRQLGVEFASQSGKQFSLEKWTTHLRLVTALLGRRYSDSEIPIVKANIPVNFILPELLGSLHGCRGLLLYSDLESFLVSALKSPQRKQWVNNVANELSGAIESTLGLPASEISAGSIPKKAASLWVSQIRQYHDALNRFDGLKSLTSDQFFESPGETIARAAEHFGFDMAGREIDSIVCSDLFNRYSKNPNIEYNAETRKSEFQNMQKLLAPDISEGMQWGEALLERHTIAGHLPEMLL